MPYLIAPYFLSETASDPVHDDCVPCAVLSLTAQHLAKPGLATHANAEALRVAAGYHATQPGQAPVGTTVQAISAAAHKLYGVAFTIYGSPWGPLWSALALGHGAAAIIRPANLPIGNVLREWVGERFTGLHCIGLYRVASTAQLRVLDPMHPPGTFGGIDVTAATVAQAYVGAAAVTTLHV